MPEPIPPDLPAVGIAQTSAEIEMQTAVQRDEEGQGKGNQRKAFRIEPGGIAAETEQHIMSRRAVQQPT